MPYQDPTEDWYYKTFFDAGEFGFGQSMVSLEPLHDCPPHAQFLDVYLVGRDGSPQQLQNAICVFEQYGGISWRHTETAIPDEEVKYLFLQWKNKNNSKFSKVKFKIYFLISDSILKFNHFFMYIKVD